MTIASSSLKVDQDLVAVGIADAVHLGDRLAELLDDLGEFVRLGQLAPVQIGLLGRDLADHETDPVDIGVAEQRVGMRL